MENIGLFFWINCSTGQAFLFFKKKFLHFPLISNYRSYLILKFSLYTTNYLPLIYGWKNIFPSDCQHTIHFGTIHNMFSTTNTISAIHLSFSITHNSHLATHDIYTLNTQCFGYEVTIRKNFTTETSMVEYPEELKQLWSDVERAGRSEKLRPRWEFSGEVLTIKSTDSSAKFTSIWFLCDESGYHSNDW